jgi:hypothetical protein
MIRDHAAYKRAAIRYWERNRIFYNLLLVPPAFLGYFLTAVLYYIHATFDMQYLFLLYQFAFWALCANICYSFVYVPEFFFGSDDPKSRWLRFGRDSVYMVGVFFSMFLALLISCSIAVAEFYRVYP